MKKHIADMYAETESYLSNFCNEAGFIYEEEMKAAQQIINVLSDVPLTIQCAAKVLDFCKEAIKYSVLNPEVVISDI